MTPSEQLGRLMMSIAPVRRFEKKAASITARTHFPATYEWPVSAGQQRGANSPLWSITLPIADSRELCHGGFPPP